MFKVLIVDDEEWGRIALKEEVDWNKIQIEIVGEAENGRDALNMIPDLSPDIIITDIRMPIMDGLELLEEIKNKYSNIITLIVSGYSEFEYAKKAIMCNAFDYILKPIDEETVEKILQNAIIELKKRFEEKEEVNQLRYYFNKNNSLIKNNLFYNFVNGGNIEGNNNAGVEFNFEYNKIIVQVIRMDNFNQIVKRDYAGSFDKLICNLIDCVENVIDKEHTCVFRNYHRMNEIILISGYSQKSREIILQSAYELSRRIINHVSQFTQYEISIGIGKVINNFEEIRESYKQALESVKNAKMVSEEGIIDFESISKRKDAYVLAKITQEKLIYYIENGYKEPANIIICDIFNQFKASDRYTTSSLKCSIVEIVFSIVRIIKKYSSLLNAIDVDEMTLYKTIEEIDSISDLAEYLKNMVNNTIRYIIYENTQDIKIKVNNIINYMQKNYHKGITLNGVADTFFLNASYLSRIFKEMTGETFNKFLNKIRMEACLEIMNKSHCLKFQDIAEMVGYDSVEYFYRKFKAFYGYTPSQYKNPS